MSLSVLALDVLVFSAGWLLAQALFSGYEQHVPLAKRLAKFVVLLLAFVAVRAIAGRTAFYVLLGAMTAAIAVLHGYWFHRRHGVHWRTAEPRDRYFKLIGAIDDPAGELKR
jgi:O-antigen/teichoic acid export membrane protein